MSIRNGYRFHIFTTVTKIHLPGFGVTEYHICVRFLSSVPPQEHGKIRHRCEPFFTSSTTVMVLPRDASSDLYRSSDHTVFINPRLDRVYSA